MGSSAVYGDTRLLFLNLHLSFENSLYISLFSDLQHSRVSYVLTQRFIWKLCDTVRFPSLRHFSGADAGVDQKRTPGARAGIVFHFISLAYEISARIPKFVLRKEKSQEMREDAFTCIFRNVL